MLGRYGFDASAFSSLQNALRRGEFPIDRNRVGDHIAPTMQGDVAPWPTDARLAARGQAAIDSGEVAVAILNGGMATRFGGRVKGVVEVTGGHSFLALKLGDLRRHARVPIFLMNSFATEQDTAAHLQQHAHFGIAPARIHALSQHISLRLTPKGELFRDAANKVSFYAPGHGDLLDVLAADPAFGAFAAQGGRMVCISNVDNLGATLDPKVVGSHLESGKPMTCEVAPRLPGDSGGAPVRRRGRIEVLESFRFPKDFAVDGLSAFNTNSFVVDVGSITQRHPLTWFRAEKKVEGQAVVQFERLLGELTSFVDSHFLEVPRDGAEGRFLPVKTPADIDQVRPAVQARFKL